MRKIIGFALVIIIPLLSCSKSDSEDNGNTNITNSDSYVKYHWIGDGGYHYCSFNINYINSVTPNSNAALNTITYSYPSTKQKVIDDELICGPFKRNDKVYIEMTNEQSVDNRLLEIYVSKDNSPFALRKSTNERKLEYIIDY